MRFADLHFHLLPGVDDGPADFEATLSLLRTAHAAGTRRLAATTHMFSPHYPNRDADALRRTARQVLTRVKELSLREGEGPLRELSLYVGAENYVSPEFFSALDEGRALSLNDGRYLLIEFSPFQPLEVMELALGRLTERGLTAVVAHAERYEALARRPDCAERLVELGGVLQVNARSLLEGRRSPRRKVAWRLLERGLAQVVASDAHGGPRGPDLSAAYRKLAKRFPPERVEAWMWQNPCSILEDRPLVNALPGVAL